MTSSYLLLSETSADWPVAPARDVVLSSRVGFQGLSVATQQYGTIRAWGPELGSLNDSDADQYVLQVLEMGFDAVEFAVSWNYQEPTFHYPVPGNDLSTNLPELKRRIVRAIRAGNGALHGVFLFCAGDGESISDDPQPGQYNDASGWTYGRQWLMRHFQGIYDAMGPTPESPEDCRPFLVFVPGYDACDAYAWVSGQNVADWWHLQRATLDTGQAGYAGYEWPAGQCQLGDGFPTYSPQNGGCIDVWLLEEPPGPYPPTSTPAIQQMTQQLGRMCRPYNRPSWAVDDPNPPYYGPFVTPRGMATVQVYEFDTYPWVRGMSSQQVDADRVILRSIVPGTIIC